MNAFAPITGHAGKRLLLLLILGCILPISAVTVRGQGSSLQLPGRRIDDDGGPARIKYVYGPKTLPVGVSANYRARLVDGAARPIIYRWRMGDGTRGEGNNVAHRYERPGRYAIIATARNRRGSDSDTLWVTVVPKKEPVWVREDSSAEAAANRLAEIAESRSSQGADPNSHVLREASLPSAEQAGSVGSAGSAGSAESRGTAGSAGTAGSGRSRAKPASSLRGDAPIDWERGGFTLMAVTASEHKAAESAARQYSRQGLRTGIYVDEGVGSRAYRVVVGQFESEEAAVAARQALLREGRSGAFLVGPLPVR